MEEIYVIYEEDNCGYLKFIGFVTSEEEAEKICEKHNENLRWYEEEATYRVVRNVNL